MARNVCCPSSCVPDSDGQAFLRNVIILTGLAGFCLESFTSSNPSFNQILREKTTFPKKKKEKEDFCNFCCLNEPIYVYVYNMFVYMCIS